MKWAFMGLMTLISNLVAWILGVVTDLFSKGMELNSQFFSGGKDDTLTLFFKTFPPLEIFYNTLLVLSVGLIFLIYLFNLYKVFFYPPNESEDPLNLTARTFIAGFNVALSKLWCKILIAISSIAYADFSKVDEVYKQQTGKGTLIDKTFSIASVMGKDITTNPVKTLIGDVAMFMFKEVIFFILTIMLIIMVIEYVKFLVEIVTRYVLFGILCVFSPLAFACLASKSTSNITQAWLKATTSQTLLICFSVFFMKVFTFSLGTVFTQDTGGSIFQGLLMLIAWLMIAQKVDTHLRDLGTGALRTGDELAMNMLASAGLARGKGDMITNAVGNKLGMSGLSLGKGQGSAMSALKNATKGAGGIANVKNEGRAIMGSPSRLSRQNAMGRSLFGRKSMDGAVTGLGNMSLNAGVPLSASTIDSMVSGDFGGNEESFASLSIGKGLENMFGENMNDVVGYGNHLGEAIINQSEGFARSEILSPTGEQIGVAEFSKTSRGNEGEQAIKDKNGNIWYASSTMSSADIASSYNNNQNIPNPPTRGRIASIGHSVSSGIGAIKNHGIAGAASIGINKAYTSASNSINTAKASVQQAGGIKPFIGNAVSSPAISGMNTPLHSHMGGGIKSSGNNQGSQGSQPAIRTGMDFPSGGASRVPKGSSSGPQGSSVNMSNSGATPSGSVISGSGSSSTQSGVSYSGTNNGSSGESLYSGSESSSSQDTGVYRYDETTGTVSSDIAYNPSNNTEPTVSEPVTSYDNSSTFDSGISYESDFNNYNEQDMYYQDNTTSIISSYEELAAINNEEIESYYSNVDLSQTDIPFMEEEDDDGVYLGDLLSRKDYLDLNESYMEYDREE